MPKCWTSAGIILHVDLSGGRLIRLGSDDDLVGLGGQILEGESAVAPNIC